MREKIGYYTYTVASAHRLTVLNLALTHGIEIYGEREIGDECSFRISLFDATVWQGALQGCGVPYTRGELRGVCGAFRKLARHPGLICGVILAMFLYLWLGGMVWEVRIVCENDIDEDTVLTELAEAGLFEGARVSEIDPDRVVTEFLSLDGGVAFATVHMTGVVAEVELIRREAPPAQEPTEAPCNLVASRDAVVTDMTVYAGKPTVKIGQTVAKGDLLVTGVLTDVGGTRLLPASATVMGQVVDTLLIDVPLTAQTRQVVSSRPIFCTLTVFGHTFTVGKREGADCVRERRLYLFERIRLPVICRVGYRVETTEVSQTREASEAIRIAEAELRRRLDVLLADGALDSSETSVWQEGDTLHLSAKVIYETNIAKSLAFDMGNK